MFEDKTLICKDCSKEFIFTDKEQEFYESKGFMNEPVRCKDCRDVKKAQFNRGAGHRNRELYDAVCADCGKETKVPFKPHLEKPIYCDDCYELRKI